MFYRNRIVTYVLITILFLILIIPSYANASSISVVVKPKLTGYEIVSFNSFSGFSDGLALVAQMDMKKHKRLYGYIDTSGKAVIPCKYLWADHFYNGYAKVRELHGLTDLKYGIIDRTGKVVVPTKYDEIKIEGVYYDFYEYFSEGIAIVRIGSKYGYVNKYGKEITACIYDKALGFSDGRALVMQNGKYGYIDTSGKEVIPLKYGDAVSFYNGYATVNPDYSQTTIGDTIYIKLGKWGLIDKDGNEIVSPKYDYIGSFSEGLAPVSVKNEESTYENYSSGGGTFLTIYSGGVWGYIDTKGNEVIPVQYKMNLAASFHNGLVPVEVNGAEVWIDTSGNQVEGGKYDFVDDYHNGYARASKDGKVGLINLEGNEVVPLIYDEAYEFSEGLARVCIKNEKKYVDNTGVEVTEDIKKWGYVNIAGKVVIPVKYSSADDFKYGIAEVSLNSRYFYINTSGTESTMPPETEWCGKYSEGYRRFENGHGLYGFLDTDGKIAVQPQYDNVTDFNDGFSLVVKEGKIGVLKISETVIRK